MSESSQETQKVYTRDDVVETLQVVEKKIVESHSSYIHSMLVLNNLLRQPNAHEIFDDELKERARDLWAKVSLTGMQITNPPLLFGQPKEETK